MLSHGKTMKADSLDTFPSIIAHLELATDVHAEPNAESVAEQNVEHKSIPPTLSKVWQQVSKRHLQGNQVFNTCLLIYLLTL